MKTIRKSELLAGLTSSGAGRGGNQDVPAQLQPKPLVKPRVPAQIHPAPIQARPQGLIKEQFEEQN